MPREVIVDWVTYAGSGFRSVLFFQEGADTAAVRLAVFDWLTDTSNALSNSVTWTVENDSRLLDNETGELLSMDTDPINYAGAGQSVTAAVPDAAQVLVRWATGVVADGRFVQGRTFIPGLVQTSVILGNVSAGASGSITAWANDFIAAAPTFGIWHRPRKDPITHVIDRPGSFVPASIATVWNELAVLRRRRK